jgi:hypothetical protein
LSLVQAVAALHGAELMLEDGIAGACGPGLGVRLVFPAPVKPPQPRAPRSLPIPLPNMPSIQLPHLPLPALKPRNRAAKAVEASPAEPKEHGDA